MVSGGKLMRYIIILALFAMLLVAGCFGFGENPKSNQEQKPAQTLEPKKGKLIVAITDAEPSSNVKYINLKFDLIYVYKRNTV